MDSLIVEGTPTTAAISYNIQAKRYTLSGKSMHEDAMHFYQPIMNWMDRFEEWILERFNNHFIQEKHTFVFDLDYYNSTAGKYIYQIIEKIDKIYVEIDNNHNKSHSQVEIEIKWLFGEDDEFMQEAGEEMQDITELDIQVSRR